MPFEFPDAIYVGEPAVKADPATWRDVIWMLPRFAWNLIKQYGSVLRTMMEVVRSWICRS
jgi:hypothetical protein